jgi:lysyl-tRNA synthetase class 2
MPRWKELKDNPKLRQNLEKRAAVIKAIRAFFDSRGYLEVETPIMVAKPGMEPHLEPFETETRDPKGNRHRSFLITSPEYAMKKLLVAGFPKIYQLTKCFRNGEDFGGRHNPEFTMLEWYRAGADYRDLMEETEELVAAAGNAVGRTFAWPFERLSVETAFRKYADRDALELAEDEPEYHQIFLNEIEPKLGEDRPTFLHDYPASMAALSRTAKDPRFAERFELYIDGLEIANAFSELTDAKEQKRRLEDEREFRRKLGRNPYDLDLDFIAALESGMPESAGIALGVDRLVMALLGEKDIGRTLAFPASGIYTSGE